MGQHEVGLEAQDFLSRCIVEGQGFGQVCDRAVFGIGGDTEDGFDLTGCGKIECQNVRTEIDRDDTLRRSECRCDQQREYTDNGGRQTHGSAPAGQGTTGQKHTHGKCEGGGDNERD